MVTKARIPHYVGVDKGFEIRKYPLPAVQPGGVMIKLLASSICGTDLHMWKGEMPTRHGDFIGHEMMGSIFVLGSEVETDSAGQSLKEGDRIVFSILFPCGNCKYCVWGDYFVCPRRPRHTDRNAEEYLPFLAGFGEYRYLVPGAWFFKVPDDLDDDLVAPINCAASTVTHGLEQARLQAGETVIVQGAGGLGLHAIPYAKHLGAAVVIVLDKFASRLAMATRMGADHVVSFDDYPTSAERITVVRDLAGGFGADVVIDCVGTVSGMQEGISMTAPVGRYVEVGNTIPSHEISLSLSRSVNERITLYLTGGYDPNTLVEVMEFMSQTKSKIPFDALVAKTFAMSDINEAFHFADWQADDGSPPPAGRVLVKPD